MTYDTDLSLLPLSPGPWRQARLGASWRIHSRSDPHGRTTVIADLVHPSKANGALIAAAPQMLDLLLRWSRSGDDTAGNLQREARRLIAEIERASSTEES